MSDKRYVVRVVLFTEDRSDLLDLWLKQFHQAGLLRIHDENDVRMVLDIYPPEQCPYPSAMWAQLNADWMAKRGINAVKVPEWVDEGQPPEVVSG